MDNFFCLLQGVDYSCLLFINPTCYSLGDLHFQIVALGPRNSTQIWNCSSVWARRETYLKGDYLVENDVSLG